MNPRYQNQAWRAKSKWIFAFALLGLLAATVAVWLMRPTASPSRGASLFAPIAVSRTNLVLLAGRLCVSGQTNPFTGVMIEHTTDGSLLSRSAILNGLLQGLSEGWHTNRQIQVREYFREGVSHGLRTKWYASGAKQSEAHIVDGKLHGIYRKWHENGTVSDEVEFVAGQPEGVSLAYFPSGCVKARVVMKNGKPVEQEFWKDGERASSAVDVSQRF